MEDRKRYWKRIGASFLSGAFFLSVLSFVQKSCVGYNPFIIKGYTVPFVFGGSVCAALGRYIIKIQDLNNKLRQKIDTLEKYLPICSNCKKIRKTENDAERLESWVPIEEYFLHKTSIQFTHGICPDCMEKLYVDEMQLEKRKAV